MLPDRLGDLMEKKDGRTGADAKPKERTGDSFPLADDLLSFLWELQDVQAFSLEYTQTRAPKAS